MIPFLLSLDGIGMVLARRKIHRMVFLIIIYFVIALLCITTTATTVAVLVDDDDTMSTISSKDVSRSAIAMKLSTIIEGHRKDADDLAISYGFDSDRGMYLESFNKIDAVYLSQHEQYCAATFRGTSFKQVSDWFTNLDVDPLSMSLFRTTNNNDNGGDVGKEQLLTTCDVHKGYHDAYANFEYRERVESFLRNCQNQCSQSSKSNSNGIECETLFIGHSQGGGIAEIAALYYLQAQEDHEQQQDDENNEVEEIEEETTNKGNKILPYVITFGGTPALGAECKSMLKEEERKRWFRYILTNESPLGKKLLYDPIPILYAQLLDAPRSSSYSEDDNDNFFDNFFDAFDYSNYFDKTLLSDRTIENSYARNGGLAYIGNEILISVEDPSAVLLTGFDSHRFVDVKYIDITGRAHHVNPYFKTLQAQDEYYNKNNNNNAMMIRSDGFGEGSICNPDEEFFVPSSSSYQSSATITTSTCAVGLVCDQEEKEEEPSWWEFWESSGSNSNGIYTCQKDDDNQQQRRRQPTAFPTTMMKPQLDSNDTSSSSSSSITTPGLPTPPPSSPSAVALPGSTLEPNTPTMQVVSDDDEQNREQNNNNNNNKLEGRMIDDDDDEKDDGINEDKTEKEISSSSSSNTLIVSAAEAEAAAAYSSSSSSTSATTNGSRIVSRITTAWTTIVIGFVIVVLQ